MYLFYGFTMSEFIRISRSILLLKDLLDRLISPDRSKHMVLKQIKKAFNRHPKAFQKYQIMVSDIVSKIAAT